MGIIQRVGHEMSDRDRMKPPLSKPAKNGPLPLQRGYGRLNEIRQQIRSMPIARGEADDLSFWHDNNQRAYRAVKGTGMKIRTEKQDAGGYLVWRVK